MEKTVSQKKCTYGAIGLGVLVVNALQLVYGSSSSTTAGEFTRYSQVPADHESIRNCICPEGPGCVPSLGGQRTATKTVMSEAASTRGDSTTTDGGALKNRETEEATHALTHTQVVPVVRLA